MVSVCVSAAFVDCNHGQSLLLLLPAAAAVGKLIPTLVLFMVVLWHETAHVLAALCYGLRVEEIELLPFGGTARVEDLMQLDPEIEAVVAVVGPISNLVLIGIIGILHAYYPCDQGWIEFLTKANLSMAALNLCRLCFLMEDAFCAAI